MGRLREAYNNDIYTVDSEGYEVLKKDLADKARNYILRQNLYFEDGEFDIEYLGEVIEYLRLDPDDDRVADAVSNTLTTLY